jgi:hypothetical protein
VVTADPDRRHDVVLDDDIGGGHANPRLATTDREPLGRPADHGAVGALGPPRWRVPFDDRGGGAAGRFERHRLVEREATVGPGPDDDPIPGRRHADDMLDRPARPLTAPHVAESIAVGADVEHPGRTGRAGVEHHCREREQQTSELDLFHGPSPVVRDTRRWPVSFSLRKRHPVLNSR